MSAIPNLPESIINADKSLPENSGHPVGPRRPNDDPGQTNGSSGEHSLWQLHDVPVENQRPIKVIVIGCGYSGVFCGIRIPERIRNCELVIYEKNAGIGGTWYENRYPGADPKPDWSSLYAPSWEIRDYIESTAKKFGVDRFIKLSHEVTNATWHQKEGKWHVTVSRPDGSSFLDTCDVLISARGNLNTKKWPDIPGLNEFQGEVMHSADWNDKYDFTNKRIGIIGSGSSAIQILPQLQKVPGSRLHCFIRGRTWISPPFAQQTQDRYGLKEFKFAPEMIEKFKTDDKAWADFRVDIEANSNNIHALTLKDTPMAQGAKQAFEASMKERLQSKPEYYDWLKPGFSPGCRRLTPGPGFLEALVEDNVEYVRAGIAKIDSKGIALEDGTHRELDVIVCATGFYASVAPPFPVTGLDGMTLKQHWSDRATNYLSLTTDQFPNFFTMLGPNGAIAEGSLTMMMESVGQYITKAIRKVQKENIKSMVIKPERVRDFIQYCDTYFAGTVFSEECSSWYKKDGQGRSSSFVTGLWPGSTLHCIEALRSPRWEDYIYDYHDEANGAENINQMGWLGNGWGVTQLEKQPTQEQLAFYLLPEFQERDFGVPLHPRPEENHQFEVRPWSY